MLVILINICFVVFTEFLRFRRFRQSWTMGMGEFRQFGRRFLFWSYGYSGSQPCFLLRLLTLSWFLFHRVYGNNFNLVGILAGRKFIYKTLTMIGVSVIHSEEEDYRKIIFVKLRCCRCSDRFSWHFSFYRGFWKYYFIELLVGRLKCTFMI